MILTRSHRIALAVLAVAVYVVLMWMATKAAGDVPLLLALYHDTNHDGQRQAGEPAAADYPYALAWTNGEQALSSTGMTDGDGMISTSVYTGTWTISGDALQWSIVINGDVAGAGVQDVAVGPHGVWLPVVLSR
jgi:hypothetical protein